MSEAVPRWGLGDAAVGWLVAVLLATVALGLTLSDGEVSLGALTAGQAALWCGLAGTVVRASRRKGYGTLAADFGLSIERADVARGLVVGVLSQFLVPVIYLPLRWAIDPEDVERPARELAEHAHGTPFIGFAIAVVVIAPVIEELFFRGLVLRSLERRFGTAWAVAGSSLAFGAAHLQLVQFPALAAAGVVFGLLAVRSGRLGPGIVAHGAFNAVAVIGLARM